MQLVHVNVTILLRVMARTHLVVGRNGWCVVKIILVPCLSLLFFNLVVWHHLEVELGCWRNNRCGYHWDVLLELGACHLEAQAASLGGAIDDLFLAENLHIPIFSQEFLMIVLGQRELFRLLGGGFCSSLLGPVLLAENLQLFQLFLLHLFLLISWDLLRDDGLLGGCIINFLLLCHGTRSDIILHRTGITFISW